MDAPRTSKGTTIQNVIFSPSDISWLHDKSSLTTIPGALNYSGRYPTESCGILFGGRDSKCHLKYWS
jgi:hypothetical protein